MPTPDTSHKSTPFDDIVEALDTRVRRRLLVQLLHRPEDEPVHVDDFDFDCDADSVAVQLHHVHLPKLADMGFVEWDDETGEVRCGPRFDLLEPVLDVLDEHEDALPDHYL
ncbi:hypothetical protein VB773_04205 [Haloarculaceae archaeon H-GB2-1]|nr:hypothetical protein [Haloarculaceae archaeon H-GB1-1]MEA5388801.1 hypothetical protein [Haloarculaceae archaeon H-GB11]MEA5406858.1 hypothetical protein [Haloarculaceae archaeon H-GB2-1]